MPRYQLHGLAAFFGVSSTGDPGAQHSEALVMRKSTESLLETMMHHESHGMVGRGNQEGDTGSNSTMVDDPTVPQPSLNG